MLVTGLLMAGGALYGIIQLSRSRKKSPQQAYLRSGVRQGYQLEEQADFAADSDVATVEEWADKYFAVSSLAVVGTFGAVWFPVLGLGSILALGYLSIPLWERAYQGAVVQRRLKMEAVEGTVLPLLLLSGYLPAAAIGCWAHYLGFKFMAMAKNRSMNKISTIFSNQLDQVWIQRGGCEVAIAIKDLQVGDRVVVQGGDIIPADGIIIEGFASIDERMMTGESQPTEKECGDAVFAFTLILTGKLLVEVRQTGKATIALQIETTLRNTNAFASSIELQADGIIDRLTVPTVALGALALPLVGPTSALIVLDSPFIDTLYITGPLSVLKHLSLASQHHLLIKDGRVLELVRKIDTIVFDKTGTLTHEQPHVGNIYICEDPFTQDDILLVAATAEAKQSHPIAKALRHAAQHRQLELPAVDESQYELGYGVKVGWNQQTFRVGSARFMARERIPIAEKIDKLESDCREQGSSLIYVAVDNKLAGVIELHPTIRPEAKQIIADLKQRDLSLYIISGDHERPTRALAEELGIEHYFSEILPEQKADLIEQLQDEGKSVCFVGDGINDAIALKKAHVSVALQGASTMATNTAQVILLDKTLSPLTYLFDLSDNLQSNIKRGMLLDVIPNAACIVGAFFFHLGIYGALGIYGVSLAGGVVNAVFPSFPSLTAGKANGFKDNEPLKAGNTCVDQVITSQ